MSRIEEYNKISLGRIKLDRDMYKDHESNSHICLMKLFPRCFYDDLTPGSYKRFHIRFYLPKRAVANPWVKIERVMVMINGLDEVDFFTLYDQLGQKLSEYDIASVLLPLPDHLNRNSKYRKRASGGIRPSTDLFDHPELAEHAYIQMMQELKILVDHLHYRDCSKKRDECAFYRYFFNPDTKVSLLGYSMGSLIALASYLTKPLLYNACFVLNGGTKLADLTFPPKLIKQSDWIDFVEKLGRLSLQSRKKPQQKSADLNYQRGFFSLFLGADPINLMRLLQEQSRRILFIMGGKDRVTASESLKAIEPKEHGLSILTIPGMGHFLPIENEWAKWLDIVTRLMDSFDENASRELFTSREIIEFIMKIDSKYRIYKRNRDVTKNDNLIEGDYDLRKIPKTADREKVEKIIFASLAYFTSEELLSELNKAYKGRLIGNLLVEDYAISPKSLKKCLSKKEKSKKTFLGEIAVKEGYITNEKLQATLERQKELYFLKDGYLS